MGVYVMSLVPLMSKLKGASDAVQCWFADNASCHGNVMGILQWWRSLKTAGPKFGYFPKTTKCCLIIKPGKYKEAISAFDETVINVTCESRRHLGAVLDWRSYLKEHASDKFDIWAQEIFKSAEFENFQSQAVHAAFSFGVKHKRTYFLQTIPDIREFYLNLQMTLYILF